MYSGFNTILIPVDFSQNTALSVEKALELCSGTNASIHLFHVQAIKSPGFLSSMQHYITGYSRRDINGWIREAEQKLLKLKEEIVARREGVEVNSSVVFGEDVEESITQKAQKLRPDLIIIGKHSHHYLLPFLNTVVPSRLACSANTPVLTAKPGSMFKEIKSVVVPVGKDFPSKKMEVMEALSRKMRLHVRLVTFSADEADKDFSRQSVIYTFSLLKSSLAVPVDFEVLRGNNRAKALLRYCNKIDADMLIVHPDSETRIDGWFSRHISDFIPANSKTQVLAVRPA